MRGLTAIVLMTLLAAPGHAWTGRAHVIVAEMARGELPEPARVRLDAIAAASWTALDAGVRSRLARHRATTFARLAAGPDEWRDWELARVFRDNGGARLPAAFRGERSRNTSSWHYVNFTYPFESRCDLTRGASVLTALRWSSRAFRQAADDRARGLVLAYLLHMVADAHQPLHTTARVSGRTCRGDRGGNDVCVARRAGGACPLTLHAYWDSAAGAIRSNTPVDATVRRLRAGFPRDEVAGEADLDFDRWIAEGHAQAGLVYSTPADQPPRPPYADYAREVALERMALAAYRLSALLLSLADTD